MGFPNDQNKICRVPFTRIHSERLELSWVASYEVGKRQKANGKHIFRSDFPVGNFGRPFKTSQIFWEFSVWVNQNSLTIYIPTEISGIFLVNGKQPKSLIVKFHSMSDSKGNSKFCFPESLDISRDEVEAGEHRVNRDSRENKTK